MKPLTLLLLVVSTSLSAQTYKVLRNFGSKRGDPTHPAAAGIIAQSRGGYLFSTSGTGGRYDLGSAFRITTGGMLQVLHSFDSFGGQDSSSGLTLATDGQYYGTTREGGIYGYGTVYKMTQEGVVTTLYNFQGGADGAYPMAPPIESEAGLFYGTTAGQGGTYFGSIYTITKYGEFTVLHTFAGGDDGEDPSAPLIQGTDYLFYGTATYRGANGAGTIFRVSSGGDFKVLYSFDVTHGEFPKSGVIQATDGNFYGVTSDGGADGVGVVFKMTPAHVVSVLHSFENKNGGGFPTGGLVQATDGNLYGTTDNLLFRITTSGRLTVLHNFVPNTGNSPYDTLRQHTNGILYGTTGYGGTKDDGVFYSLNAGLKPLVTYLSTYGRPGALVQILGQGFSETSQVFFNGTPASFKYAYPTYIRATVPDGATTGPITVTTASGTLTSNKVFVVHKQ